MNNNIPSEYHNVIQNVQSFFKTNQKAECVFAASLENGDIELMEVFIDSEKRNSEEKKLVQRLTDQGNTRIVRSVCIWKNGTFDVISGNLLKLLMNMHLENAQALHLLKKKGFNERTYFSLLGKNN